MAALKPQQEVCVIVVVYRASLYITFLPTQLLSHRSSTGDLIGWQIKEAGILSILRLWACNLIGPHLRRRNPYWLTGAFISEHLSRIVKHHEKRGHTITRTPSLGEVKFACGRLQKDFYRTNYQFILHRDLEMIDFSHLLSGLLSTWKKNKNKSAILMQESLSSFPLQVHRHNTVL